MRLYVASEKEIVDGAVSDIYFVRTTRILREKGVRRKVRMEYHTTSLPKGYEWAVYAGLEEILYVLKDKPVTVYSLPEGTLFKPGEPLLIIEGYYDDIAVYETALLGIMRHYTSIATKAARMKRLAIDKTLLFFGLRALHPALAPMADRAAYIGGLDAVSGAISEKYLGLKPVGTMPHALIIVFGDQVKAWKAFDEVVEEGVPRIMLVDTFCDERMESLLAAKVLGKKLYGVRLDTPSSRRGNMRKIVEEVRWTLDIHGYKHVKIIVSGGIGEKELVELRDIVDSFGIGTSISFPKSIDISADIVEIYDNGEWIPVSKRGKLPGAKQLYRRRPGLNDYIGLLNRSTPPSPDYKPLLKKYIDNGELIEKLPSIQEIRNYVLEQLREVPEPEPV
ncbi:nicotinate phosphoribosyltransferase [Staphylothermus hellenicus]|uniref:nicotinate phosphoribosyltransferase n=1 Tax=Staphylothermus hellenicus (strain DSM 12710 / JCM 10830 / BK20S6-10-b1 / P8) TaxID=591019 RepID=D7DBD2_STAHD|nr:nicotinate phosphoribosyltransferase [Staphylothermus hellenicus]ADI31479.1 Quinolinate phosphoribosyl transferase [Staphylothermus hellenicus DSM 12710]